ncbi:hypothetical protein C8T65DRAFT_587003 [Cerioporus squamosus]|nr:hypothetical protein C8T65DRAFT_587003 [Cerioporus squamosus]
MLIGSVFCLYPDQAIGDIYLSYAWTTAGELVRISSVCITHGLSAVTTYVGNCPAIGVMPNDWTFHHPGLGLISVNDQGPQHMHIPGAQMLLPILPPVQPTAVHIVNGVQVATKPVQWHHRVTLEHVTPGARLHYHQHTRRRGHTAETTPILPQNKGKHKSFRLLVFNTQVQISRRIQQ